MTARFELRISAERRRRLDMLAKASRMSAAKWLKSMIDREYHADFAGVGAPLEPTPKKRISKERPKLQPPPVTEILPVAPAELQKVFGLGEPRREQLGLYRSFPKKVGFPTANPTDDQLDATLVSALAAAFNTVFVVVATKQLEQRCLRRLDALHRRADTRTIKYPQQIADRFEHVQVVTMQGQPSAPPGRWLAIGFVPNSVPAWLAERLLPSMAGKAA